MELEGYSVNDEFKKYLAKLNSKDKSESSPYHQIFTNMREAATSIYDQYLSDKVIWRGVCVHYHSLLPSLGRNLSGIIWRREIPSQGL